MNLEDCFNHLQYISDPVLRKHAPKISEDDEEKKSAADENVLKTEDDIIFESLLAADEIEE